MNYRYNHNYRVPKVSPSYDEIRTFNFSNTSPPVYHPYSYDVMTNSLDKLHTAFLNDININIIKFNNNLLKIYFVNTPYLVFVNSINEQYKLWVEVMGNKTYEFGFDELYITTYEDLYFEIRMIKNNIFKNMFVPSQDKSMFVPSQDKNIPIKRKYDEYSYDNKLEDGEVVEYKYNKNYHNNNYIFDSFIHNINSIINDKCNYYIKTILEHQNSVIISYDNTKYTLIIKLLDNNFYETILCKNEIVNNNFGYIKPKVFKNINFLNTELKYIEFMTKDTILNYIKSKICNQNDIIIIPNRENNTLRIIFKDNNDNNTLSNTKLYKYSLKITYPNYHNSKNYCKVDFNKNGKSFSVDALNLTNSIWIKTKEELIEIIDKTKLYVNTVLFTT